MLLYLVVVVVGWLVVMFVKKKTGNYELLFFGRVPGKCT
jgi:hypothetical protein